MLTTRVRHPLVYLLVSSCAATLLPACSSHKSADNSASTGDRRHLEEVIVTAQKRDASPTNLYGRRQRIEMALPPPTMAVMPAPAIAEQRERYQQLDENGVKKAAPDSVSTLSLDVDTGSYANARRFIEGGMLPPSAAVRVEEFVNYFRYDYPQPKTDRADPFVVDTEIAIAPWNADHLILRVGVKAVEQKVEAMPPANLTFLVDVSGSMQDPKKLPLVQSSLKMLVGQLRPQDRVALIVYAGRTAVELPSTSGADKDAIIAAIARLQAGGSTAGESALRLAYAQAKASFIKGGINRILLATDGDFNVGLTNTEQLLDIVKREREAGITLTTLGFGTDNYNEEMMERIADAGNGNYAYIDSVSEAKKVLVDEMSATFNTVAKDVKVQIEFNAGQIAEWRLIGYENRVLREEDFKNDKVDAGEVGAGKSVTALYELTPIGKPGLTAKRRYGNDTAPPAIKANELAELRVRYKQPNGDKSTELRRVIAGNSAELIKAASIGGNDLRFASAVAAFGQRLKSSNYLTDFDYAEIATLARGAMGRDVEGYRHDFVRLVETTQALTASTKNITAANTVLE